MVTEGSTRGELHSLTWSLAEKRHRTAAGHRSCAMRGPQRLAVMGVGRPGVAMSGRWLVVGVHRESPVGLNECPANPGYGV